MEIHILAQRTKPLRIHEGPLSRTFAEGGCCVLEARTPSLSPSPSPSHSPSKLPSKSALNGRHTNGNLWSDALLCTGAEKQTVALEVNFSARISLGVYSRASLGVGEFFDILLPCSELC
ncbi:hypothetical protein GN956_G23180 [Arapaima gigas]